MRRLIPIVTLTITGTVLFGDIVFAESAGPFARLLGVAYADMRLLVIRVLQIIWFFAFVGSLGFLIYGFVLYRRADPEDLEEEPRTKRIMLYSGIAAGASLFLLIILSLAYFLIEQAYRREQPPPPGQEQGGLGGLTAISQSKIRDHYPTRDERNVPRDTSILITFAEKVQKESVLDSTNAVRRDSILIRRSEPSQSGDYGVVAATGVLSVDGTTLKILPSALLGEPNQKLRYTVALTPEIRTADNDPLFTQAEAGYSWQFEVSGLIDTVPPTVETYLPLANSRNPINTLIQVTFSEPIDPFTVIVDHLSVRAGEEQKRQPVTGAWSIGNGYRTITFFSSKSCGTNQCGSTVFCLPAQSQVAMRIKAAAIGAMQSARDNPNKATFPYTGIVDTAGNSLDGGGLTGQGRNGKSDGAEVDDFFWNFLTATEKETTPPTVASIGPERDAQGVNLAAPVTAIFSTFMDITSLNNSTIGFSQELATWVASQHLFSERHTRVRIHHEPFAANQTYTPVVRSSVTDIYQNCYNPCSGPGTGTY